MGPAYRVHNNRLKLSPKLKPSESQLKINFGFFLIVTAVTVYLGIFFDKSRTFKRVQLCFMRWGRPIVWYFFFRIAARGSPSIRGVGYSVIFANFKLLSVLFIALRPSLCFKLLISTGNNEEFTLFFNVCAYDPRP